MNVEVRVRFAPSPTGPLHLGNARAALFNFLFARRHDGAFILRVEDTDTERSEARYESQVMEAMRWLGLTWDEGPDVGGPCAPYRQSERRGAYVAAVERLVAMGKAYPCFCTEQRLEELHLQQKRIKRPPRYDGLCRALSTDEVRARLDAGEPHTVRLALPEQGEVVLDDLVRGRVTLALKNLDDFIIQRSNGNPLFILAGVVDDADMRISHVLRGEDHLTNTHKQLLLHEALGSTPPRFGHLPLVTGDDGHPLSKRLGDLGILNLREQGYAPEVICAHLARLGWQAPDDATTLPTLGAAFAVDRVAKKPAKIGLHDLKHRQALWLRAQDPAQLARDVQPLLAGEIPPALTSFVQLFAEEAETLNDLARRIEALVHRPNLAEQDAALLGEPAASAVCAAAAQALAAVETLDVETAREVVRQAGAQAEAKGKGLYLPLRLALMGAAHGPDVPSLMAALGKEEALARLRGEK